MIGGAQMSPMHCNFMINTGTATGYDLETLGSCALARQMGQHRWYDADESPANRSKDSKHRSWKMCAHGSNT